MTIEYSCFSKSFWVSVSSGTNFGSNGCMCLFFDLVSSFLVYKDLSSLHGMEWKWQLYSRRNRNALNWIMNATISVILFTMECCVFVLSGNLQRVTIEAVYLSRVHLDQSIGGNSIQTHCWWVHSELCDAGSFYRSRPHSPNLVQQGLWHPLWFSVW